MARDQRAIAPAPGKEENGHGHAGRHREAAGGREGTPVRPPHLPAPYRGALRGGGTPLAHPRHHAIWKLFQVQSARASDDGFAHRLRLRRGQRQPVTAGGAAAHVVLHPSAVVVRKRAVVQGPEQGHHLLAAPHDSSSGSSRFGASSPRYSRSLFCIFSRAWKSRLITVPLRIPRTFARSS